VAVAPAAAEVLRGLPAGTLEELFIVAEVCVVATEDGSSSLEPRVQVDKAAGEKCPRCWNIRTLGTNAAHPAVCARCAEVLTELGFEEGEASGEASSAGPAAPAPKEGGTL
jgi:isoleucyl-tRNA synthetase